MALPKFLLKRNPKSKNIKKIRGLLNDSLIHTVCESAKCPNIGECYSRNTLTFMLLGNICTRNCRFCGVEKGAPSHPDLDEPKRIAEAARKLKLEYAVVTSVTRDDLPDGGASIFAAVIKVLRPLKVEALIPDFKGDKEALSTVLDAGPFVLNHNLETIPRLYPCFRPQANHERSLNLLKRAKNRGLYTKSGLMVGLGETKQEIFSVLKDLRGVVCDFVTIGQYLPPSKAHPKAARYVHPDEFKEYCEIGEKMGFQRVFAGPFVRSSYHAEEAAKE